MKIPSSPSSIAESGLRAATTRLAVSAQNTANVNTAQYVPLRAESSEVEGGGVRVSISRAAREASVRGGEEGLAAPVESPNPLSKTDLVEESVARTTAVAAYRSNLKTLETQQAVDSALFGLSSDRR